ncbi:hypothetical protein BDV93DRAFT_181153 [Ceratobasidium sp. AG-I]|nr:hypothetical protein BDV93DRAFT_181153 [Ceratobasidium sp. AG-I]
MKYTSSRCCPCQGDQQVSARPCLPPTRRQYFPPSPQLSHGGETTLGKHVQACLAVRDDVGQICQGLPRSGIPACTCVSPTPTGFGRHTRASPVPVPVYSCRKIRPLTASVRPLTQ